MGLIVTWWERYHQGTSGPEFAIGLWDRLLIASHAIWFYAGKLICPIKLTFIYPRWNIGTRDPLRYGWLLGLIGMFSVIYFLRRKTGRGPEVGIAFFISTLSPLLGFLMLYSFRYSFVADHYQYVASIGLIALFASTLSTLCSKFGETGEQLNVICGVLLLVVLAGLASHQARIYRSSEILWNDTLAKNPNCWMAHNNLAVELCQEGRPGEAVHHFEQALAIKPDHFEAEDNLGNALLQMGRLDESVAHYRKALEINPNHASAHNNLGNAFLQIGRLDEAVVHCQKALEIKPDYAPAHNNLANAFFRRGELDQAISHYRTAIELQPDLVEALNNLGVAFEEKGLREEAIGHYEKAFTLKPDYAEAHCNLAGALLSLGRRDEAVTHLIMALRIKPTYAKARRMLERLGVPKTEWNN
jgi:tetratricopeptide (TPR) repeat protein